MMQTEARTGRDRRCRQRQEQGETDEADRGRERQMMQTEAGRDRRCRQRQGETDDADRGKNRERQTIQTEAKTFSLQQFGTLHLQTERLTVRNIN